MIFRTTFYIVCFNLFFACKGQENDISLIGTYKEKSHSFLEKTIMHFKNETYILKSILVLKKDSTYLSITCGTVNSGLWKVNKDSLYLFCKMNRYINDSLNRARGSLSCGIKPQAFQIILENPIRLKEKFVIQNITIINNLQKQED